MEASASVTGFQKVSCALVALLVLSLLWQHYSIAAQVKVVLVPAAEVGDVGHEEVTLPAAARDLPLSRRAVAAATTASGSKTIDAAKSSNPAQAQVVVVPSSPVKHCVDETLLAHNLSSTDQLPATLPLTLLCQEATSADARLPHPAKMAFGNYYWQVLQTSNEETAFLYSAFYDDRVKKDPAIRLLAMIDRWNAVSSEFACVVWNEAGEAVATTRASVLATRSGRPRPKVRETQPFMFSCYLAAAADGKSPFAVSLVEAANAAGSVVSNVLRLEDNRPAGKKGLLGLCLKPSWFEGRSYAQKLAEWFELQFILGVEKVLVAPFHLDRHSARLFRHYQDLGKLEVLAPFSLSSLDKLTLESQNATQKHNIKTRERHEDLTHTDCMYRSIHRFRFMAVLDTDEVFLPLREPDLRELLFRLEEEYPGPSGRRRPTDFSFMSFYFLSAMLRPEEHPPPPPWDHMSGHEMRSTDVKKQHVQGKSIVRVSTALTVWIHRSRTCRPGKCRWVWVSPKRAIMAHYRKWCREDMYSDARCWALIRGAVRDDSVSARWGDRLGRNTRETLAKLDLMG